MLDVMLQYFVRITGGLADGALGELCRGDGYSVTRDDSYPYSYQCQRPVRICPYA